MNGRAAGALGKGNRNRQNRQSKRRSSSLADHSRRGKILEPPLVAIGGTTLVAWWRDYLPDYLWLCWSVSSEEYVDVFATSRYLDEVEASLDDDRTGFPDDWILTGKLSGFEAIPPSARQAILERLFHRGAYDSIVPEDFAVALAMYPNAPGRWMIQPWLDRGLPVDPAIAERRLRDVVGRALDGRGNVATRAKALLYRQLMKAGRVGFSADVITDELKDAFLKYPSGTTDEQNSRLESHVRAALLAMESLTGQSADWAKDFWRANWKLYACQTADVDLHADVVDGRSDEARDSLLALVREAEGQWDRFIKVASTTDPDLYAPDRFEVLTGLVGRALRLVRTIAGYPLMWTMEHGAPVLRALVESRIILRYLLLKEEPELYEKFKAYGIGHLKLLKLHMEEFIDAAGEAGEGLQDYLDLITAYVNRDQFEEYVSIDLGGNFAGVDMRKMAAAVDLGDDYRLLFAPASSNVHGEWGAIDMNVFEPCLNPLHARHRAVADQARTVIGPHFIADLMNYSHALIDEYIHAVSSPR